ncbi:MAG TPA: DNA polymerase ligase N-terminal domain-containing protein [Pseudonocardiaceae bacterium]|jgi:DNA ligase D-like protein (predicted 3'-phosphoesterase)|nr:DNA polymerase ligase N-terminal domain-containing protein [Pseudonocardiaceae bacterium]
MAGNRRGKGKDPMFVIQRHDASTLHFDFRLEVDGVLASWAVPKGPSTDPRDKRLAAQVDDHPLDYATFEGVLPEGSYGAGTVIVWDIGDYHNETRHDGEPVPMAEAIANGHIRFRLDGHKLTGSYALTRTAMGGDKRNWLLVKIDDDGADRRRKPTTSQPESVLTGRTNDQLAQR